MKKILIGMIIVIMIIGLVACGSKGKPKDKLNLSDNLNYSEEKAREKISLEKDVLFAKDGLSDFKIVLPKNAGEVLKEDAEFLRIALNKIVNREETLLFEIVDIVELGTKNIFLGDTQYSLNDKTEIKDDGFIIKIDDNGIFIFALKEEGVSNGIYTFLENYLECMFAREDFSYYPYFPTIYFDKTVTVDNPDFSWRKIFAYETVQNEWFKRIKTNGSTDVTGTVEKNVGWGTWCHNVFLFVDPNLYFESKPEYYALINGERRIEFNGQDTQLCLTNEEIYPIIEAKMAELMNKSPNDRYWDFSLNDNYNACQCENCTRVANESGSMMGTMLPIINKLARKFPDKIISTLAYFYNITPPKGIELEKNVNITIAPIATGQLYSFSNPKNYNAKNAASLIKEWSEITDNILIWDYIINFSHLLLPYPNFDVQRENLLFYKENNVKNIFHQASREKKDELANLRAYVLARQLWDIDLDIDNVLGKYLTVTYGKADKYVAEYLDKAHNLVKNKAKNLDLYDDPSWHATDYLSNSAIKKYTKSINKAIEIEKDNLEIVFRLEEIKINILYAKMHEISYDYIGKKNAFKEFSELVIKHEIAQPYESKNTTMQDFLDNVYPYKLDKIINRIITVVILICLIVFGVIVSTVKRKNAKKGSQK